MITPFYIDDDVFKDEKLKSSNAVHDLFLYLWRKEKMEKQRYYISTAIAYTSGKPHIGNTYEVVLADAIARFKRQQGYDVYFQTGTDEHGQKIELKAEEAGVTPKEFVDNVSGEIKRIWDLMNTSYDKFIRTTDKNHEEQVKEQLTRQPFHYPTLAIRRRPASIFDYEYDDFEVQDYEHHPAIKAPVAV